MRLTLLLLLLTAPAAAQTPILLALRANNWSLAQTLAAGEPDSLAPKLVTFIRLLNPGQATATELATFLSENPTWPDRPTLERRYGEALTEDSDTPEALTLCRAHPPQFPPALARCADALALAHDTQAAEHAARTAWTTGLDTPELESAFLARWVALLTPTDQKSRFDLLARTNPAAATRQLARLPPSIRAVATALLALRHDDPAALQTMAAIPADLRTDPPLLLAEARFLRRTHATEAALALWRTTLPAAEAATPAPARAPFWTERDALARALLQQNNAAAALTLAEDPFLPPDQATDSTFLAGWIAVQKLHNPQLAQAKFQSLAALSHAAITQSRALYWRARATQAPVAAHTLYLQAAAWPLTYYGQLAARAAGLSDQALHAAIRARHDPAPTAAEQTIFARLESVRAATILAAWQDNRRAADFLTPLIQPPATLTTRTLTAQLALRLALPDIAVQAARLAGRDGSVLPDTGWPTPVTPPPNPAPSLTLAIIRQESSFDPAIISPAGAHGLMQLLPATATQLGRTLHLPAAPLSDPDLNMRLGTAYLAQLLTQFAPCQPCAIAAYNAGPHRVQDWLAVNPNTQDTVDWIEQIPFAETRNYVQRVMENIVDYDAKE